jgi:hypothetical protein
VGAATHDAGGLPLPQGSSFPTSSGSRGLSAVHRSRDPGDANGAARGAAAQVPC